MPTVTRSYGALHFEDLEPKRFEDLVRQVAYDFRPWRKLEATGRSGSDDGFDARGYEAVVAPLDDETQIDLPKDRLWLIQCKREKTIPPKKLVSYLNDIRLNEGEQLHGIVFAAACDFSKKARDGFAMRCRELGLQEWFLLGKAELEDMLMRPQNDGLLFAYFGFSLGIRRRSRVAAYRAKLATKRKAERHLDDHQNQPVLIRALDSDHYPDSTLVEAYSEHPPWLVRRYQGYNHEGLEFLTERRFAYLSDDGVHWDAVFAANDATSAHDDPWQDSSSGASEFALRNEAWTAWQAIPQQNQAWLEVTAVVSYDHVAEIDELGDDVAQFPHVIVDFDPRLGPFIGCRAKVTTIGTFDGRSVFPQSREDNRVEHFPAHLR